MGERLDFMKGLAQGLGCVSVPLAAVGGVIYLAVTMDPSEKVAIKPDHDKIRRRSVQMQDYSYDNDYPNRFYVHDLDGDFNTAESISWGGASYWIAPGFEDQIEMRGFTRVMTPEIREAASRHLRSGHDLSIQVAEETYRLEQEKGNKEE